MANTKNLFKRITDINDELLSRVDTIISFKYVHNGNLSDPLDPYRYSNSLEENGIYLNGDSSIGYLTLEDGNRLVVTIEQSVVDALVSTKKYVNVVDSPLFTSHILFDSIDDIDERRDYTYHILYDIKLNNTNQKVSLSESQVKALPNDNPIRMQIQLKFNHITE